MMKKSLFAIVLLAICNIHVFAQSVGINADGSTPDNRTILDVKSTNKGVLLPRMTDAQRNALGSNLPNGMIIFNTDDNKLQIFVNNFWYPIATNTGVEAYPSDIDGNVYTPVTIGSQKMLLPNVSATKFNDGTSIAEISDNAAFAAATTPAYGISPANGAKLYNAYVITSGKNICPDGYRVMTAGDWDALIAQVGANPAYALRSTTSWANTSGTNASGFDAKGYGYRDGNTGLYQSNSGYGFFWTSTAVGSQQKGYYMIYDNPAVLSNNYPKSSGMQIRCIEGNMISLATVTTTDATSITSTTASSGGNVTANGGGTVSARGVCWSTSANPNTADSKTTDGTGTGTFTSAITGLSAGTTYYVRAYATNEAGTVYGSEKSFTTIAAPTVTTTDVTSITATTASSGGDVTADGGGTVSARGVCWSTSANPTTADSKTEDGTGTGSFTSAITGLSSSTTYYVRAYVTNESGTAYGSEKTFTTTAPPAPTDGDGNTYTSVNIGSQTWLVENLKTTKYMNGTSIPNVTDGTAWSGLSTHAYCWYNNDIGNKDPYGALYNWYTVNNEATYGGLCPTGYRVPTLADWNTLESTIGTGQGGKLKETGTTHWNSPNTSATNVTGFTGVGTGIRQQNDGTFSQINQQSWLWSSTLQAGNDSYLRILYNNYNNFDLFWSHQRGGHAIRCVKE